MRKTMGIFLLLLIILLSGCVSETELVCGANQTQKGDICVDISDEPDVPNCTDDETLLEGLCVPKILTCTNSQVLQDGVCTEIEDNKDPVCDDNQVLENHLCVDKEPLEPVVLVCDDTAVAIGEECISKSDIIAGIDNSPSVDNTVLDTKEDVLVVLNNIATKMVDTIQYHYEPSTSLFTEEYPLVRSELNFSFTKRYFINSSNTGSAHSHHIQDLVEHIESDDSFVEDEWTTVTPTKNYESRMYKLYINGGELHYYYYYFNYDYTVISGYEGIISNDNDILEFSIHSLEYSLESNTWTEAASSQYIENESLTEKVIAKDDDENIRAEQIIEYNIREDIYLEQSIVNYEDLPDRRKIVSYNPNTGISYEILYKDDIIDFIEIYKYNEEHETVFHTIRYFSDDGTESKLNFYFNLMLIDGWTTIGEVGNDKQLFINDTMIELPDPDKVHVETYSTIWIKGSVSDSDQFDPFNLTGTPLTPPITYEELIQLEETIKIDSNLLYQTHINNMNTNSKPEFDSIQSLFDEYITYMMLVNKSNEEPIED